MQTQKNEMPLCDDLLSITFIQLIDSANTYSDAAKNIAFLALTSKATQRLSYDAILIHICAALFTCKITKPHNLFAEFENAPFKLIDLLLRYWKAANYAEKDRVFLDIRIKRSKNPALSALLAKHLLERFKFFSFCNNNLAAQPDELLDIIEYADNAYPQFPIAVFFKIRAFELISDHSQNVIMSYANHRDEPLPESSSALIDQAQEHMKTLLAQALGIEQTDKALLDYRVWTNSFLLNYQRTMQSFKALQRRQAPLIHDAQFIKDFHVALKTAEPETIDTLLTQAPYLANIANEDSSIPWEGSNRFFKGNNIYRHEVIKILLRHGANLVTYCNQSAMTATDLLHGMLSIGLISPPSEAKELETINVFKLMLQYQIQFNTLPPSNLQNGAYHPPKHYLIKIVEARQISLLNALLGNPNITQQEKNTALRIAIVQCHGGTTAANLEKDEELLIIQSLLVHKADILALNDQGKTMFALLIDACCYTVKGGIISNAPQKFKALAKFFIAAGVNIKSLVENHQLPESYRKKIQMLIKETETEMTKDNPLLSSFLQLEKTSTATLST